MSKRRNIPGLIFLIVTIFLLTGGRFVSHSNTISEKIKDLWDNFEVICITLNLGVFLYFTIKK